MNIRDLFDRISFAQTLVIWLVLVILFGFLYFIIVNHGSSLYYNQIDSPANNIIDAIYFSFEAGTTSGFGDIFPLGFHRIVAIIEIIFGLILFAIMTSKLISIKQDAILSELYDISFQDRINKLRSSLLLFRQNVNNIIHNMQEGNRSERRVINNVDFYLVYLENIFQESSYLVVKNNKGRFIKQLDPVNTEIIFNSLLQSLEKLHELILVLDHYKIRWKSDSNIEMIKKYLLINEELFERLNNSKDMIRHSLEDLNQRKDKVTRAILNQLK